MYQHQQVLQTTCGHILSYGPATVLTSSGGAPSWCKLGKGPRNPHPLHQGLSPQLRAVTSLSPSPKVSSRTHYPFPSVAISKPGAAREPLVGPLERAAPHPSAREETTRTSGGRAAQPQPVSQPSPRSLLFSPQRPPSGPPESSRGVGARLCLRPRSAPAERPGRSPAARSSQGPACPPPRRAGRARAAPSRDHGPWGPTTASPDAGEVGAAPTALRKPRGTPRT